ncbi:hypothetical protein [Streptomyces sp. NPDC048340]
MANTPEVTVGAPDGLGLRKVLINGKPVGKARSPGELRRILRRADLPDGQEIRWLGADGTTWPDRAWQRRTEACFMAAGLLATACPLFKIGQADSGNALTYGGRIAGVTILAAAVVELIAALAVFDYWRKRRIRYSGVAVLAGVVIAFLCSVILLVLQIGEQFNDYTLAGMILLAWSSVALYRLIRCKAWKGLRNPRKIAIGAIISFLLAGSNLAYSLVYVPYVRTPLILSGAEFKESSLDKAKKQMYATVRLSVRNSGQVPVYVLGSIYWIHGGPASSSADTKPENFKLIFDGEFITPGRVLNPGEVVTQDAVVEIKNPETLNYEAIRAQTEVYVIRKDRMTMTSAYARSLAGGEKIKREAEKGDPLGATYRYRSQISNSSEILNVTRGRQLITLWRVSSGDWPRIVVDVSPPGKRIAFDPLFPNANEKAFDRYGLTQVRGSTAQTPYPELLEKARAS